MLVKHNESVHVFYNAEKIPTYRPIFSSHASIFWSDRRLQIHPAVDLNRILEIPGTVTGMENQRCRATEVEMR